MTASISPSAISSIHSSTSVGSACYSAPRDSDFFYAVSEYASDSPLLRKAMDEVRLYFTTGRTLRLFRIECVSGNTRHVAIASRAGVATDGAGQFRWSRAVRGVSILFVRFVLARYDPRVVPRLEGGRGSIAACLDGALSQEPVWLVEMFGVNHEHIPRYRRLFVRSNPGLKRCGPVAVSCTPRVKRENIRVFLNDAPVVDKTSLERILAHLMSQVS